MKLRSDMLFLTMVEAPAKKFIILTDGGMRDACLRERQGGRTPNEIEFLLAEIPDELSSRLLEAKDKASREVSPKTRG